jgi:hypothetical protein
MRGLLFLAMGCHCAESGPNAPTVERSAAQTTPFAGQHGPSLGADQPPETDISETVQILESGEIRFLGELFVDESTLRSRLPTDRLSREEARSLEAHPAIPWSQVRPVLAIMAEPPGPGFVFVHSRLQDRPFALAWWTSHPGQVPESDDGKERIPLTFTLDLYPSGMTLNGFHLESEAQVLELLKASLSQAPGGTIPVRLQVDPDTDWGDVLELASALDHTLGEGRVAIWHLPPGGEP